MMPTFSLVMTVNERPIEVLENVFKSIPANAVDELVIVFDRTPESLRVSVAQLALKAGYGNRVKAVSIEGPPGWGSPIPAWNAGFKAVTSEYAICFSSEVIFEPGSFDAMKKRLSGVPCVVYGACRDSGGHGPVTDSEESPFLLCSPDRPRPLGFIYGLPTWALRVTGGMEPELAAGFWYDDDDWCMQLWQLGLPFVFVDDVAGVHQSHDRPDLKTPEGLAKIEKNRAAMLAMWGALKPWDDAPKLWAQRSGVTVAVPSEIVLLHAAWGELCQ